MASLARGVVYSMDKSDNANAVSALFERKSISNWRYCRGEGDLNKEPVV